MHFGIRGSRAPIVRRYLLASPTMNSGMLDVLRIIFHGGTLCQDLISISIATSSANDPLQKVVKRHNSLHFSRNVSGLAAYWSLEANSRSVALPETGQFFQVKLDVS
jgi:hypothetical protein